MTAPFIYFHSQTKSLFLRFFTPVFSVEIVQT
ncbi:hypothetical protein gpAD87_09410 [Paenibacillus sp. AD87]|nr:hypothetical protein gpAD87_09410 [Paenibacillus sp. AD87]